MVEINRGRGIEGGVAGMSRAITRTVILIQAAASRAEADRFLGRQFATHACLGCAHSVALWPPPL